MSMLRHHRPLTTLHQQIDISIILQNYLHRHRQAVYTMDHSHHAGMDHGHMDHGDMGGSEPMCSMNVSSTPPPFAPRSPSSRKTDALHLGHDKPLHRLPQLACDRHILPDLVSDRRRGVDSRLRSHPRSLATLRRTCGRECEERYS